VILPAGPKTSVEFLCDTIESVLYYCEPSTKIAIFDDSAKGHGEILAAKYDRVFSKKTNNGGTFLGWSDFWIKLSRFYLWLAENHRFRFLLRIDDDNLIIGNEPENEARQFLTLNPQVGLLGQIHNMPDGTAVDNSWQKAETERELSWQFALGRPIRKFLVRTKATKRLRSYVQQAQQNGWKLGESVAGGGYFLTKTCIYTLAAKHYLSDNALRGSELSEDHLLTIAVAGAGCGIQDFAGKGQPIAYNLRGLPLGYDELITQGKKIVHSVRRYGLDDEAAVRAHFRALRSRSM